MKKTYGLQKLTGTHYNKQNKLYINHNILDTTNNIQRQFKEYRQVLLNAKTIEKDSSFIKEYSNHINWLDKIEAAFNDNDNTLLTDLIERESRSYGWSYLPNDYGEKVESAFWNLKKLIVGQD